MPVRTRSDMHIGLELALEVLVATPMNRLDPPIKDYFLNRTISEFVKNVINKANQLSETKEVLSKIPTVHESLSKYNDIYTLVTIVENITPTITVVHQSYTLPSNMFRFEASYSTVHHKSTNNIDVILPNFLLNTNDIGIYNNSPIGKYLTGSGNILWYDFMGSILDSTSLKVYHLDKYVITTTSILYIKRPAVLTSSPSIVNCDLPESVHDRIVDDTAKFIAAATASGNYQELLMEAKQQTN